MSLGVPNLLTVLRIAISPLFLTLYLYHDTLGISSVALPYTLLCLLSISELSDLLDGYIARRFNQVTDLGKVLDPMADSITHMSVFFAFTKGVVQLPLIMVFVFLYRDSLISTLRTICGLQGTALAARTSGKIKAVVQAVAAFAVLIAMIPHSLGHLSTPALQNISLVVVGIAAACALFSAIDYIYAHLGDIRFFLKTPGERTNVNS